MSQPLRNDSLPVKQINARVDLRMRDLANLDRLICVTSRIGQLGELIVTEQAPSQFVLIDGYRRLACLKALDMSEANCLIHSPMTDNDILALRYTLHVTDQSTPKKDLQQMRRHLKERLTADELKNVIGL